MAGQDEIQAVTINPALERAQRIERAFIHVARAIELDLADVALDGELDATTEQELRAIGAVLLRVSQIGMNTANSVAGTLGETPTPFEQPANTKLTVQTPPLIPQARPAAPQAPAVLTPPAPEVAPKTKEQTILEPVLPPASRLDRQQVRVEKSSNPRKSAEKKQYEGELYQRIVSEKVTPKMELREGMEPVPVRIIMDDTIIVNGEKIILDGDKLFAFNAIMKLRDDITSGKEMRKLGFRMQGSPSVVSSTFSKAMAELMSDLEQASGPTGINIIKKIGKAAGTKYAVNPAVTLVDERFDGGTPTPDEMSDPVKKN